MAVPTAVRAACLGVALALAAAGCGAPPGAAPAGPPSAPTTSAASPPPPPGGTPSPADTTPPAERLTLTVSGDLLWHDGLLRDAREAGKASGAAYDFRGVFSEVRSILRDADVSICHVETPVVGPGQRPTGYPTFASPRETLSAVRAVGFDYCTTASNHAWDQGFGGLVRTLDALDAEGIVHAGASRTPEEAATPRLLTTESGVRVAVVAGTYGHNRRPTAGRAWSVDALDADGLIARGRAARAAGADLVLAALHAGTEHRLQPNAQQVRVAGELARSGVFDFVYGHHAHVPQPWTRIDGTWVMYGGGNLVAQMKVATPRAYEAYLGRLTFERRGDRFEVVRAEYIPLLMTLSRPGRPARVLPVVASLEAGVGDRERLEVARERVREAATALDAPGLEEA